MKCKQNLPISSKLDLLELSLNLSRTAIELLALRLLQFCLYNFSCLITILFGSLLSLVENYDH